MHDNDSDSTLYLFWHEPDAAPPAEFDLHGDAHPLNEGMWLIRSELTRSKLYHRLKWQLPDDTSIMVAPLLDDPAGWPKFKGMAEGALAWLRGG